MGSPNISTDQIDDNATPSDSKRGIKHSTPKCTCVTDSGYLSETPVEYSTCSYQETPNIKASAQSKRRSLIFDASTGNHAATHQTQWMYTSSCSQTEIQSRSEASFDVFCSPHLYIVNEAEEDALLDGASQLPTKDVVVRRVDIFKELTCVRSMPHIVTKILCYLTPRDLCAVACVSQAWKNACLQDSKANARRILYLENLQLEKENKCLQLQKSFTPKAQRSTPASILGQISKNSIRDNQVLEPSISKYGESKSTKSPSCDKVENQQPKSRFEEFLKEAENLQEGWEMRRCPRCYSPSHMNKRNNQAFCQKLSCCYVFCALCQLSYHSSSPCKTIEERVPIKKAASVGSKRSKKNLQRL